jgi:hypothetical protein
MRNLIQSVSSPKELSTVEDQLGTKFSGQKDRPASSYLKALFHRIQLNTGQFKGDPQPESEQQEMD